ncbi:MAG: beta strand repeat-containing protein, partial [Pirellulales bacterium]
MRSSSIVRITAVAASVFLGSHLARAAVLTWDNGGGDQLWTTVTNWNPDGTPSGNDVVFANTGTAAAGVVTNDTDGNWTINTLNFLNTGSSGGAQTTRIASSQTLTISGTGATAFSIGPTGSGVSNATPTYVVFNGGGALAVTGGTAATFAVATGSASTNMVNSLNMSALGSFTANIGSFMVANNARQAATVLLSSVTNSITTTTFTVGSNSNSSGSNYGCFIGLGAANTLFANTINIGSIKSSGTMTFQGSVTNGAVTIRDYAGTGAATLVLGAQTASSGATSNGVLDFTAGRVDALFSTVTLGQGSPSTGTGGGLGAITLGPGIITSGTVYAGTAGATTSAASTAVGTVNLLANSGTFAATSMVLGRQANAQPANGSGVVNQAGGVATIGTLTFANYTAAGTGLVSGTYNLSDGTLRAATIQAGANSATTGTSSRTFNWSGGTIQNFDSSTNLTIAGSNSFTLLLAGTSTKAFSVDTGRTITTTAVIGSTGTAGFSKDGPGTLVLASGGNWFSGTTTINAGVLN